MSWSLQLRNGDLALDGARLGQVTGSQKLVQDLRCALLEPRGTDDLHPLFGSMIDGGRDESGRYVPSVIGEDDWERAELQIYSEIQRIVSEHQQRQIIRSQQDRRVYGESTLSMGELLVSLVDVSMTRAQDMLMVHVTLRNGDGSTTQVDIPVI